MPHPDLEALLNVLLPFAQQCLGKNGEFYPFGAIMGRDGETKCVMAQPDESEQPQSQDVIDMLTAGYREAAAREGLNAIGICFDARVVPPGQSAKSDAICVRLEHVSGEAVEVYVPYRKAMFGRIKYRELFACPGRPAVFPPHQT